MTDDRSHERAARSWIEAGPTEAPDRAVEAALLRIETLPQERDLRIPWRLPKITTPARVAAAAVIGVLLIAGGYVFIGNPAQPAVGPKPSPSAKPGVSPGRFDVTSLPGWIVFGHTGTFTGSQTESWPPDSIWLVRADGSGLHELAPGAPVQGKLFPDISPDGAQVVFNASNPPFRLWEVGIDGGGLHQVETGCLGDCFEGFPAYSPDGDRIAFTRGIGTQTAIGIVDRATGKVLILQSTNDPLLEDTPRRPSWSPDGTQIVYHVTHYDVAKKRITDSSIWIVNADGSGLHQLALPDGIPYGDADWSPDGSRIVLSSWPIRDFSDRRAKVFTVRPDGSDLRSLTDSTCGGCGAPAWTPDGAHILYWGANRFWLMEPDGSDQQPIDAVKLTSDGDTLGYADYGSLQPTP